MTSLIATFLTLALFSFVQAQDAKAPDKGDKKDPPVKKDTPPDKKDTDDKGKDDKKKPMEPATPKFTYGGTFVGKLKTVTQKGELTVTLTQKIKVTRPNAAQVIYNYNKGIADRQYNIAREQNPQQRFNLINDLNNFKVNNAPKFNDLYEIKELSQDVIVQQAKEIKLRVAFPELQYDAKGNPVQLTKEKLKELQGPEGYPGYPTELSNLTTNTMVQVYLAKPLPKDPKKKGPDVSDIIGGGKTPTVEDMENTLPQATVIFFKSVN
jgi:hypothetical protein